MIFSYEDRILREGRFVVEQGATVRQTAKEFKMSKSCVHKDLTQKLPLLNNELYQKVKKVLFKNFSEKHLRGGVATQIKYEKLKGAHHTKTHLIDL